ncbi:MAG TPA: hypothetical protein VFQ57_05305 [Sphingomonas sp.]|nr:hypothetical protein [Sphingomonas sp.]
MKTHPPSRSRAICLAIGGWQGLVVGLVCSTLLVYHATFCINSLAHVSGRRRYVTGDDSRNNWLLAIATMGEGWHNHHHAFRSSARQGFRGWEVGATYYILLGTVQRLRTACSQGAGRAAQPLSDAAAIVLHAHRPSRVALMADARRMYARAPPLEVSSNAPTRWCWPASAIGWARRPSRAGAPAAPRPARAPR